VTISCSEGEAGRVYAGLVPFEVQETQLDNLPRTRTKILMHVGNPEEAFIPFCRTPEEGRNVLAEMEKHGLNCGENGLQVYVMCEIPSNVILAGQFSEVFDGFSIGSNDLTQLTLGLDRDSALVAHIFDERNDAVKDMVRMVIAKAKKNNRKIGICGQAPSDYPEFAQFLVELGIDSMSLNPDSVMKTLLMVAEVEKEQG
jgi:pyruvate,water dikinase